MEDNGLDIAMVTYAEAITDRWGWGREEGEKGKGEGVNNHGLES